MGKISLARVQKTILSFLLSKKVTVSLSSLVLILLFQNCGTKLSSGSSSSSVVSSSSSADSISNSPLKVGFKLAAQDKEVAKGQTVTFKASLTFFGTPPSEWTEQGVSVAYKWVKDGSVLNQQNGSELKIINVNESHVGTYSVQVTISGSDIPHFPNGTIEFNVGQLSLLPETKPVFTQDSLTTTNLSLTDTLSFFEGDEIKFGFGADGGNITFKKYKDGRLLTNTENSGRIFIAKATKADEGTYRIEASNSVGEIFEEVKVVVKPQISPRFIRQLNAQRVSPSGSDLLIYTTVEADQVAVGGGITFKWFKDNVELKNTDRINTRSASLKISSLLPADSGTYLLEASNSMGKASQTFNLLVNPTLPVISSAYKTELTVYAGDRFQLNSVAKKGETERWYHNERLITGSASGEFLATSVANSGTYKLELSNSSGTSTKVYNVTVLPQVKPFFDTQPQQSRKAVRGSDVAFLASAVQGGGVQYRWYYNSIPIPFASKAALQLRDVDASYAGQFKLEAFNGAGKTIVNFNLEVTEPTAPVLGQATLDFGVDEKSTDLEPGRSFTIFFTGYIVQSPVKYRWYKNDILIPGKNENNLKLSNISVEDSGTYRLEIYNEKGRTSVQTVVSVLPTTTPSFGSWKMNNIVQFEKTSFDLQVSNINNDKRGGALKYRIYKDGILFSGNRLTLYSLTSSDSGVYTVEAFNEKGTVSTSFNLSVVPQQPPQLPMSGIDDRTVYEGESLYFTLGTVFNDGATKYRWYKDEVLLFGETNIILSRYPAKVSDSGTYKLEIYNDAGSVFLTAQGTVKPAEAPAFVNSNFIEKTYYEGDPISLTGNEATGGFVQYTWSKDNSIILNQKSSVFSKPSAVRSDSGLYKVVASNSNGSVSKSGRVTVLPAVIPIIGTTLRDVDTFTGANVSLRVSGVVGGGVMTYKWYKNNELVLNANGSSLNMREVTPANAGTYRVEVSNHLGTTTSTAVVRIKEL